MLHNHGTKSIFLSAILSALSGCMPCNPAKLAQAPPLTSIPAAYQEDISFIKDARKLGIEHLGLHPCSQHYTWFRADEAEGHTLYILSITKPTVLPEARNVQGKNKFLHLNGSYREDITDFFYLSSEKDTLEDERDYYNNKGFDVYWRSTTNYNNSGNKKESPITSSFLAQSKIDQIQVLFHETCHDSVERWIGKNFSSELNESFCSLVGYAGAAEYFREKKLSKEHQEALHSFTDHKESSQRFNSLYGRLQLLYKSPMPATLKLEMKNKIFEKAGEVMGGDINNAVLWSRYPYEKYFPLMAELYEKHNQNVRAVVEKMKDCPEKEEDALKFINRLLQK